MCTPRRLFGGGGHLVFESSQTMNDIPFGDHFRVESRWDFSAQPPGAGRGPAHPGAAAPPSGISDFVASDLQDSSDPMGHPGPLLLRVQILDTAGSTHGS